MIKISFTCFINYKWYYSIVRCHNLACDLKFDRQVCSDSDEIWIKIKHVMRMLGHECRINLTYFLFFHFLAFVLIFGGDYLSSASWKAHGCNLHIFIFLLVYFELNLAPGAVRKGLMST